jgi:hypothetical protein
VLNRLSSDSEVTGLERNIDKRLPSLDWGECLGEKVGKVLIGRDIWESEGFVLFKVMLEPVIAHIDVASAMLID